MDRMYDLKGSTFNRFVEIGEQAVSKLVLKVGILRVRRCQRSRLVKKGSNRAVFG